MEGIVIQVYPEIDYFVRGLCKKAYHGHKKGCPNYGRKKGCPPDAGFFDKEYDLSQPVYAIINVFDYKEHVEKMKEIHPDWSQRQPGCCLY